MDMAAATLASPALAPLAASTRTVSAAAAAITTAMTGAGAFVADRCGLGSISIFGGIVPRVAPARAPCPADPARVGTSYIAGVGIAGIARGGDPAAVRDAGLPGAGRGTGRPVRSQQQKTRGAAGGHNLRSRPLSVLALCSCSKVQLGTNTLGEERHRISPLTQQSPLLGLCRPMNSLSYPHVKERSALQCRQHRVRPRNERGIRWHRQLPGAVSRMARSRVVPAG